MPIDPSILRSAPFVPNFRTPGQFDADMAQQQSVKARAGEQIAQVQREQQLRAIVQKHGGDLEAAAGEIAALDPELGQRIFGSITARKQQQRMIDQQEVQGKEAGQAKFEARVARIFAPDVPEAARASYYSRLQQEAQANGYRLPESMDDARLLTPAPPAPRAPGTHVVGGNLVQDDGTVLFSAPTPEPRETNPTEASLALAAAQGDKSAERALAYLRGQKTQPGGGGAKPDNSALVAAVAANPALFSTLTPSAQTELIPALSAQGFKFPTAASSKPATGVQTKNLAFFNRARQADEDLQRLEPEIAKMGLLGQERMQRAPNFLQTETGQLYNQAQRAFTEARLRKDSGAAIPDSEFANDRQTYFPQPGDTQKTLQQKARARAAVLASLAFESGPALSEFYGEDAGAMVEEFKKRSAAPQSDKSGGRKVGDEVTYKGKRYRIKAITNGDADLEPI